MNILSVCSALNNTYLGLEFDDKKIGLIIKTDENYHSLYLISKIKELFNENNFKMNDLNAICVNFGPGSFNGIRVALTVAKVMAGELDIPLIPLNTAEILLKAFDSNVLLMDARRDMYFYATSDGIELIYKDKLPDIANKKIVADKNCSKEFENAINFEEQDIDLGLTMLELAKEKYNKTEDKNKFNYLSVEANYIQTPPVF